MLDDVVGFLEGVVRIAVLHDVGKRLVGAKLLVDERRFLAERLFHVGDDRKGFVVHAR